MSVHHHLIATQDKFLDLHRRRNPIRAITFYRDNAAKLWHVKTLPQLVARACRHLDTWLNNPNGGATNDQRAVCDLPPRNP